jgi:hypothetical protein
MSILSLNPDLVSLLRRRAYNKQEIITNYFEIPYSIKQSNYSGVAKAGMNGVPKKASTSAENMDSPCLRAVER